MTPRSPVRTRKLRMIAQDPAVRVGGSDPHDHRRGAGRGPPARAVGVPRPGHRLRLVHRHPAEASGRRAGGGRRVRRPVREGRPTTTLLTNPQFHAQNVYAIVMLTLARFEFGARPADRVGIRRPPAQGRPARLRRRQRLLLEPGRGAVLRLLPDGREDASGRCVQLPVARRGRPRDDARPARRAAGAVHRPVVPRPGRRSTRGSPTSSRCCPCSPSREVVTLLVDRAAGDRDGGAGGYRVAGGGGDPGGAAGVGRCSGSRRRWARRWRTSAGTPCGSRPSSFRRRSTSDQEEFFEPHRRGEILVAAMMNAFIEVWAGRLKALAPDGHERPRPRPGGGGRSRGRGLSPDDGDPRHRLLHAGAHGVPRLPRRPPDGRPRDPPGRLEVPLPRPPAGQLQGVRHRAEFCRRRRRAGPLAAAEGRPRRLADREVHQHRHPLRVAHPRPGRSVPVHLAEPPGAGAGGGGVHPRAVRPAVPAGRARTGSSSARPSPSTSSPWSWRPANWGD